MLNNEILSNDPEKRFRDENHKQTGKTIQWVFLRLLKRKSKNKGGTSSAQSKSRNRNYWEQRYSHVHKFGILIYRHLLLCLELVAFGWI
jgi:hypothetical protein